MPTRIFVPGPEPIEEARQIAESIADLQYATGTIVEGAKELIPGESIEELTYAWNILEGGDETSSFRQLITNLTSPTSGQMPRRKEQSSAKTKRSRQGTISVETLGKAQLTGEVGRVKRRTLRMLFESFFMFWNSEPRTEEKRVKASEALIDYLEFGATLVSSIPGQEIIVAFVSLVKQLVTRRAKRGV